MSEIEQMIEKARKAQAMYVRNFNQKDVDYAVKMTCKTVYDHAEELARMAVDETQMGVYKDKVAKNQNKSKGVWWDLKGKKSMGILSIDERTGLIEIAKPIGVVAGVTPMTNPIVTPMSKIAFALKSRNAIIISPHPRAKACSAQTVDYIVETLENMNLPDGMIQVVREPSRDKTLELMSLCDVTVATGGMPMVKSAYSSGKPSFGVGAGNVQVILDRDIDYNLAVSKLVTGRAFDNGIICSGEQSCIYAEDDREAVMEGFRNNHAYICNSGEREKIIGAIFEDGHTAKDVIGQSCQKIAKKAGIVIPDDVKVIVLESNGKYGADDPISKEKMCPVIAAFPYKFFEQALQIAQTNLSYEGKGHTAGLHSNSQANIIKAGCELSVSRLIVNAICATTAGGSIQNGLPVTNTLGCGSWGGNSISENFTFKHLLNITRVAPLSTRLSVPSDDEIWYGL